jgi:hypothetical protein
MTLTRVYPNGQRVVLDTDSPSFWTNYRDVEQWRSYNQTFRFGCALYEDGVCVYPGTTTLIRVGDRLS